MIHALARPRISIATVVVLALVAGTTLVLGIFAAGSYRAVASERWQTLGRQQSDLADQLAVALALPAWNFDGEQIDRILDGAMKNRDVSRAVVRLTDRNLTVHEQSRQDQRSSDGDLPPVRREIEADGRFLGHLELYSTARYVAAELAGYRRVLIASVLATDAVIVLGLYLLLRKLILRPVLEIQEFAAAIASGDPRRDSLGQHRFVSELEQLRTAVETMINLLDTRYVELQRSEEQFRHSEARLRLLGDNLPASMVYQVVQEPDGTRRFVYVSGGVERLHGVSSAAVLRDAQLLYAQVVPQDREAVATAESVSLHTLTPFNAVLRSRGVDGRVRWMQVSSAPRRLPDGTTLWDGIETDISGLKQAEEELRESEVRFKAVFESSFDAVAVWREGRLVYFNQAFLTLYGYRHDAQVLGRPTQDFFVPEHHALIQERRLRRARGEPVAAIVELHGLRPNGTRFEMEVRSSGFTQRGETFTMSILRDITASNRAGKKMAGQLEELQRWQRATLGRESRIRQLKQEVNALHRQLGLAHPYPSVDTEFGRPVPAGSAPEFPGQAG